MRQIKQPTKNAGEFLLVIALLLAIALSIPLWLNYGETVQAGNYSSNAAGIAEQTQPTPTPTPTPVFSRGVAWHGAEAWKTAGYQGRVAGTGGRRIKVGIIDVGFNGFSDLQRKGELPSNTPTTRVWTKCYPVNTLTSCESTGDKLYTPEDESKHGAAVAEIIIDMAPEVELYISNPRDKRTLQETVVWMAQQGVDVINQSLRWSYFAPGDGTYVVGSDAPHSLKAVDLAVNGGTVNGTLVPSGALWVNSGGNEALKTWSGPFTDEYGNNNAHEFATQAEGNTVSLTPGKRLDVALRWQDQWGYDGNTDRNSPGANCDLRLNLYRSVGNLLIRVPDSDIAIEGVSNEPQGGGLEDTPYEIISYTIPTPAMTPSATATPAPYVIYINRKATSPCATPSPQTTPTPQPAWLQMRASVNLEHTSAGHHIAVPAESTNLGMLAVGAARSSSLTVEDFSSRGPDLHNYPDGRTKPNLVGATCVRTVTDSSFCGTSAAAPHVAGMAALMLGRNLTKYENKPTVLAADLKANAVQRGEPNPNNSRGEGFAYLPHPTGTASFSVAPSVIYMGQSRRFTVNTNIDYPPGVQVKVSSGSLALSSDCTRTSTTRRTGTTISIWGCSESRNAKIWIYDGNNLLRTYTVRVQYSSTNRPVLTGKLMGSSTFRVYRQGNTLFYYKQPCVAGHVQQRFFLHLTPSRVADLPASRRQFGFDNKDFNFSQHGLRFGDRCLAVVPLPSYTINQVSTGQTRLSGSRWVNTWSVTFSGQAVGSNNPAFLYGELMADTTFDVYRQSKTVYYYKSPCTTSDTSRRFAVHIYPVAVSSLPSQRRQYGFDNKDFSFSSQGWRFDGKCLAVRQLPNYAINRVNTGQAWRIGFAMAAVSRPYDTIVAGTPKARSTFNVYLKNNTLYYAKSPCTAANVTARFALHIYPRNQSDLPAHRRRYRFDNKDFLFDRRGLLSGGKCLEVIPLPNYSITRINTGQSGSRGRLWTVNFRP